MHAALAPLRLHPLPLMILHGSCINVCDLHVQLLKDAGPRGSTLGELVSGIQESGLKTWTDMRVAKSSIASTCGHDLAFGRLPQGRFALRGLPGVRQVSFERPFLGSLTPWEFSEP